MYSTFDELKYGFEGEHSYVLVSSKNLPQNFQGVYVEGIYAQIHDGGDSSEEDSEENEDEEEDSKKRDRRHRLHELKIRVYNHTVEFKKNRELVVSTGRTPMGAGSFPSLGLTRCLYGVNRHRQNELLCPLLGGWKESQTSRFTICRSGNLPTLISHLPEVRLRPLGEVWWTWRHR